MMIRNELKIKESHHEAERAFSKQSKTKKSGFGNTIGE